MKSLTDINNSETTKRNKIKLERIFKKVTTFHDPP